MMQWTGPAMQVAVPWTRSPTSMARAFADKIDGRAARAVRRRHLDLRRDRHALLFPQSVPRDPARDRRFRRRLEQSRTAGQSRARRGGARGLGINGLPILALEPDLDRYFDSVIGGPGAF